MKMLDQNSNALCVGVFNLRVALNLKVQKVNKISCDGYQ